MLFKMVVEMTQDYITKVKNSDEKNFTDQFILQIRIISMPNFFCFGNYEVNLYKKHEHDVDNFYPVGSLKASYYKSCLSKKQRTFLLM